jgi:3-hydroxybutyryl-CoA dehydratase
VPRKGIPTLCLDDLHVGDEWESPSRTVTESDVVNFAGLSGDFNPIHMDHDAAKRGPFRRPIAHGLLGLAVASGLSSHAPKVDTLAFLAILEWKFLHPIFFGDTVRVVTKVVSVEPGPRNRRGVVTWHRRIVNQQGKTVQEGTTLTLVRNNTRGAGTEPSAEVGGSSVPSEGE